MVVLKKRSVIITSVLLIVVITFIVCIGALSKRPVGDATSTGIKIVLDAGHGGIDGGVTGVKTGVKESELNLLIVKRLEKYLSEAGFSVVLTRSSDAGLYGIATKNLKKKDMEKRKEIINSAVPSLVVSVHLNKFGMSSRRGAQVFYKESSDNSKILANSIQSCFNEMEDAPRQSSALTGDYYILNCSEYPSVICECGFLSNPEDEALLITEDYRDKIAYTIFKGVVGYLAQTSSVKN